MPYYTQGQLSSRTWARTDAQGQPLVTSYNYTSKGQLTKINYSDDTPDVSYYYDGLGRIVRIIDGTGLRIYNYDAENLQLKTEIYDGVVPIVLYRARDQYNRPTGYALDYEGGIRAAVAYTFGTTGLLSTVNADTIPESISDYSTLIANFSNASANTFTYERMDGSSLIGSVTGPAHTVRNSYEINRDILTKKQNELINATIVSQYDYTVNALGQRTTRTQSGSAFNGTSVDTFGYNPRGEVTSSINNQNAELNRDYNYDPIGNRLRTTEPNLTRSYVANNLNQYTTVVTVPSTVNNPTFDLDGNMLTDGTGKRYTWDAENRLIQVTLPNNEIVRYSYDGESRRIKREEINGTNTETTTYLYDGWDVIEERAENSEQGMLDSKFYTWGLDLSDTQQGAGGVGGLLSLQITTRDFSPPTRYYYAYDANGNVSELLDGTGAVAAHYTYDAFGKATTASGPESQKNTYRFSTKPWDSKTELNYYGYRFYQPKEGRWINRDPIEESGGINVYFSFKNNALTYIDLHGLDVFGVTWGPKDDVTANTECCLKKRPAWKAYRNKNDCVIHCVANAQLPALIGIPIAGGGYAKGVLGRGNVHLAWFLAWYEAALVASCSQICDVEECVSVGAPEEYLKPVASFSGGFPVFGGGRISPCVVKSYRCPEPQNE